MLVNKETKHFQINPVFPSKLSWEFSRKEECNSIIQKWPIVLQALKFKGRKFLELNDDNSSPIHLIYFKDRAWLKHFGSLNSLCVRVTRLVINHVSISEYRLRLFGKDSKEPITCPCNDYSIETRRHILFECPQYRKSWNPKKSLKDILTFLEFNPGVFCFQECIT